jgi:hypothetical protein
MGVLRQLPGVASAGVEPLHDGFVMGDEKARPRGSGTGPKSGKEMYEP